MKYIKNKDAFIRIEYDGIYVMNSRYQTKTKITDKYEQKIFIDAMNGKDVFGDQLPVWLNKHFLDEQYHCNSSISGFTSNPIYMTLGITSGCNYQCKHCGNDSTCSKNTDLTPDEIYELIDQMVDFGLLKLNFTGGEPLLNPELINYIMYAKGQIPRITLTTNGSLVVSENALKLKQAGLNMAKISIDGAEEFHDYFRGVNGAYCKAINAIRCFQDAGVEVRVQSTLTNKNTESIIELMRILAELGIPHQTIVPVCPIGRAGKNMMLSPPEYKKYIYKVYEQVKTLMSEGYKTNFQIRPVFGASELFDGLKTSFETLSMKYSCEALLNTMEIQPNGDVVACSFLEEKIGNIRNNTISEIWNSIEANDLRDLFLGSKRNKDCVGCKKDSLCNGGCLANRYYFNDFQHADPYCFYHDKED